MGLVGIRSHYSRGLFLLPPSLLFFEQVDVSRFSFEASKYLHKSSVQFRLHPARANTLLLVCRREVVALAFRCFGCLPRPCSPACLCAFVTHDTYQYHIFCLITVGAGSHLESPEGGRRGGFGRPGSGRPGRVHDMPDQSFGREFCVCVYGTT